MKHNISIKHLKWMVANTTNLYSQLQCCIDFTTTNGGALLILLSTYIFTVQMYCIYVTEDNGWILIQFHKLFICHYISWSCFLNQILNFLSLMHIFFLETKWLIFMKFGKTINSSTMPLVSFPGAATSVCCKDTLKGQSIISNWYTWIHSLNQILISARQKSLNLFQFFYKLVFVAGFITLQRCF